MSQLLSFKKLRNIRDLGGMKTRDGRMIKPGMLIRAGQLSGLDPSDREALQKLVAVVIDFRTDEERLENPDVVMDGVVYHHILLLDQLTEGITREERADKSVFVKYLTRPAEAKVYMNGMYRTFMKDQAVQGFAKFLRCLIQFGDTVSENGAGMQGSSVSQSGAGMQGSSLSQSGAGMQGSSVSQSGAGMQGSSVQLESSSAPVGQKAVLWHCTAGKDRAGIASALIEELLGVPRDDIITDYLKTNEYLQGDILFLTDFIKKQAGIESDIADEALRNLLGADEEYIGAYYAAVDEKFGSFDVFVRDGLGLSAEDVARLKALYLAEA